MASRSFRGSRSAPAADRAFAGLVGGFALLVPLVLAGIALLVLLDSLPAIRAFGVSFLLTTRWDPVHEIFGAAAFLYGTIVTTTVGVVLAAPVAIGAAVYLTEYSPRAVRAPLAFLIELLAYIPSIVYGLWALFVLVPISRDGLEPLLKGTVGRIPIVGSLFSGPIVGVDLLVGGLVLAVMILPILVAIIREVLLAVPPTQREAMIGLGATRWEAVTRAVLPYARPGIIGAVILGVARAFGETMAVTMVVGNSSTAISPSLFTPGYTMASAIANQFTEAVGELYFSAIVEIALVLLIVAILVNTAARLLIRRTGAQAEGAVL